MDKDVSVLSHNISRIDRILSDLSLQFSKHLDEVTAENVKPDDIIESENLFELKFNASEVITKKFEDITGSNFKITEMNNLIDSFPPKRRIFIDEFRCIGCGECMNVCPVDDALWLDTPAPVHVTDSCVLNLAGLMSLRFTRNHLNPKAIQSITCPQRFKSLGKVN